MYRKALEILEKQTDKQLIAGLYENRNKNFCAIGVLCPSARGKLESVELLAVFYAPVARELSAIGLTVQEALELQDFNDTVGAGSSDFMPHHRYIYVVNWLRNRVRKEQEITQQP